MSKTPPSVHWLIQDEMLNLSSRALLMGILNTTPDSFSDGGHYQSLEKALTQARQMIQDGADIIDIGGESTRPGADPVSEKEELSRTVPLIQALRAEWSGLISIDTTKATVAEQAMQAGANIINDVSALENDPLMPQIAAATQAGLILMHAQGAPKTMQDAPQYEHVVSDIRRYFEQRLNELSQYDIRQDCISFDPGIGFGKTLQHNQQLIKELDALQIGTHPLAIGLSRKSFIAQSLACPHLDQPENRDALTATLTAHTRQLGARIHRVHNVPLCLEALRFSETLL